MPSGEVIVSTLLSGLLLGGMHALIALGLTLALGVMGLVNLAHGEFLVAGAYVGLCLLQQLGIDPLLGLPFVGVVVALAAWPVQRVLLAPLAGKGGEAAMMTMFGLSIILQNLYVLAFSADTRTLDAPYAARPLQLGSISVAEIYVLGFVVSAVLVVLVHWLVAHSAFGRELRASASDPLAAAAMGVDVRRVQALTFALAAGCAAMGGVLIALTFSFTPTTGSTYLLISFAVVVLGGVGNILGTLAAGIVIGLLQSAGAIVLGDGYRDLVGLVLFLLVLALRPSGIGTQGRLVA
jgi:branched-chain amino acid transport system permease protein